jgi:hypothetical protein
MSVDELEGGANVGTQSLKARMEARAEALQQEQTEKFEIPGYEGLVAVELRRLPFRTIKRIQQTNMKVKDEATRDLYNIADQIARATVSFHEVKGDDFEEIELDWVGMAHLLPHSDGIDTPRKAILFLIPETRIHFFAGQFTTWAGAGQPEEDEEVRRDF